VQLVRADGFWLKSRELESTECEKKCNPYRLTLMLRITKRVIFGITRRNSYALLLIHCITNGLKYWITQNIARKTIYRRSDWLRGEERVVFVLLGEGKREGEGVGLAFGSDQCASLIENLRQIQYILYQIRMVSFGPDHPSTFYSN
jgi:hypothetical protein